MNHTDSGSRLYLFSIVAVAVLGGLLFGYDTAVISGAEKGLQAFFLGAKDFVYTDTLHGITSSSALIGCIIGSAISGFLASRLGRKPTLMFAGILFLVSALGSYYPEFFFFAYGRPSVELLVAFNLYRIIGGVGVGLASAICPMYIAEVAPSNLRGTLVARRFMPSIPPPTSGPSRPAGAICSVPKPSLPDSSPFWSASCPNRRAIWP